MNLTYFRNSTAPCILEPTILRGYGSVGKPKLEISEKTLLEFRSFGFIWKPIAGMLLVLRWTLGRRVKEQILKTFV